MFGGGVVLLVMNYSITNLEDLYKAWKKFKRGKSKRDDIIQAEFDIEKILYNLDQKLIVQKYQHNQYHKFVVCDPKQRIVHKANVVDRIMHQYIVDELFISSEKRFICDTYACRKWKGVHLAVKRLEYFIRLVTNNNQSNAWYLKCDIKKFFDSIDHSVLLKKIKEISTEQNYWIIKEIVSSFSKTKNKGLPLGNVTSQLFANYYLNDFDHFLKHSCGVKYYIRYADDFIIIHPDRVFLERLLEDIIKFLEYNTKLVIHPNKITIKKVSQGVDFLGYIAFPWYTRIRHKTQKRILKKMKHSNSKEVLASYKGFIKHAKTFKLQRKLERLYELNKNIENH